MMSTDGFELSGVGGALRGGGRCGRGVWLGEVVAGGKGDMDQADESGDFYEGTDDSGEGLAGCGAEGGDADRESAVQAGHQPPQAEAGGHRDQDPAA